MNKYFLLAFIVFSLSQVLGRCGTLTLNTKKEITKVVSQYRDALSIVCLYQDSLGNAISTDSVYILYNQDMTPFCKIEKNEEGDPVCEKLKGKIVSYYPSWSIITLFSRDFNKEYMEVEVGGAWKLLNKKSIHRSCDLRNFLQSLWYTPQLGDSLYSLDRKSIKKVNKSDTTFNIIDVQGDWIKLKALNNPSCYWFRWKNNYRVYQDRLMYE